jgi:hypothetical protein
MRLLILTILLSSCTMIHKTTDKHIKDSTASSVDQSKVYTTSDSLHTINTATVETADLVVIFKDSTAGFVSFKGDSISIPAASIKEIRKKKIKQQQKKETTKLDKDQVIINDTRNTVSVKEKTVTKEKKVNKISWFWILLAIPAFLLYKYKGKIYAILKAFTIG